MPKSLSESQFGNNLPRWSQKILLGLLGFLLIGATMYFQRGLLDAEAAGETNRLSIQETDQKVVRLEVQFEMIEKSLVRIEKAVDRL